MEMRYLLISIVILITLLLLNVDALDLSDKRVRRTAIRLSFPTPLTGLSEVERVAFIAAATNSFLENIVRTGPLQETVTVTETEAERDMNGTRNQWANTIEIESARMDDSLSNEIRKNGR